ncbi:stage II sporulation protein D [Metabacillus sp. GX 13764]|uniref:stage II sporulation protein D n=1 Tax=Metabacillus kandeliae TaxID=2900151 RepID=UPI001E310A6C|nr:stage II sporulation protein D [Metabacillus kandeliae]MCD7034643.1 stage II sporulation protein D [Metabacillus kandeliae]
MKSMKPVLFVLAGMFIITLLIPAMLVVPFANKTQGHLTEPKKPAHSTQTASADPSVMVSVYRTSSKAVEKVPLEEYVTGVVGSEMPPEFNVEALKAQSLAARTYIVKYLLADTHLAAPENAAVTDTPSHQVYHNKEELKKLWGPDYNWKIKKVQEAVQSTKGEILTYDNKPINAQFFSTSNGYTENSEAVWSNSFPYLKSVSSSWDKESPKYHSQKIFSVKEFEQLLGVKIQGSSIGTILERTPGKRVASVSFNGKKLSGTDIRHKLDLRSADFSWERKGNNIIINTIGYGHGVGMSQYGANYLAEKGKKCNDIIAYYYKGVSVASDENYMPTLTAKY